MQAPSRGLGLGLALVTAALVGGCAHAPTPADQTEERRIAVANGWLLGRSLGLGTATPLAFVHGVGGTHHLFEPQLQAFRNGRRVLGFDQRGCGGSADAPGGEYDLDTRVRDLTLLLDVLRVDAMVLVSHGTGGQVVARYAERNPDRVLGLVLIDPVSDDAEARRMADLPDADLRSAVDHWLGELLGGAQPETREGVLAAVGQARIPAMRAMLSDAAGSDLTASLAAYLGPVLILAAPDERLPAPLRPGIDVRRLNSGSHWSPLDAPDEVEAALREFVRPIDEAALRRRRSR
jgi:pimeloyl-ACP methyl ester carboxylesterase